MTELAWIDAAVIAARPQAMAALLRYFRDLDKAEEAYQEACLRALSQWSERPLGERAQLCEEAIRLTRLLLRLFPMEAEVMGLLALQLLQHARLPARYDAAGLLILLEHQDRMHWNHSMIGEGLALIDKAMRHKRPGPYQVQAAIAALHARNSGSD
jgi:predicted RNA polymerase sigma factor